VRVGHQIVGLVLAYVAVLVPGLASVYNPHQYESDPLFQPAAIKPLFVVAAVAVAVMWLFARRWSARTVNVVLVTGLGLTVLEVAALVLASMQPMRQAGPLLTATAVLGILAMPCVSVLSVAAGRQKEGAGA
jgi:hypothetical protein